MKQLSDIIIKLTRIEKKINFSKSSHPQFGNLAGKLWNAKKYLVRKKPLEEINSNNNILRKTLICSKRLLKW